VHPPAKSPFPFVALALGGVVAAVVAFILMNLLFGAGGWLPVLGYVVFVVWLISLVAIVVGVVGAIRRAVK